MYKPYFISSLSSFDEYNYVIITSNDLYNSITSSKFIGWKSNLGYNIKIVNITDSLISDQNGFDLAEQIRNFLRNYYAIIKLRLNSASSVSPCEELLKNKSALLTIGCNFSAFLFGVRQAL